MNSFDKQNQNGYMPNQQQMQNQWNQNGPTQSQGEGPFLQSLNDGCCTISTFVTGVIAIFIFGVICNILGC